MCEDHRVDNPYPEKKPNYVESITGKPKPESLQCNPNEHTVVFLEGTKRNYLICTKCGWRQQQ